MNRRGFLGTLGLASAGMVLDPELALWVPGRRTFFDMCVAKTDPFFYINYCFGEPFSVASMALKLHYVEAVRDRLNDPLMSSLLSGREVT